MDWWHQLSDNQTALIACVGGLAAAWFLLVITHAQTSNNPKSGNSRQKSDNRSTEESGSRRAA